MGKDLRGVGRDSIVFVTGGVYDGVLVLDCSHLCVTNFIDRSASQLASPSIKLRLSIENMDRLAYERELVNGFRWM